MCVSVLCLSVSSVCPCSVLTLIALNDMTCPRADGAWSSKLEQGVQDRRMDGQTINKITNNLSQNRPDSKLNSGHQGILCWNIDFICSYKNDKLKHKFYNNYLIIEK